MKTKTMIAIGAVTLSLAGATAFAMPGFGGFGGGGPGAFGGLGGFGFGGPHMQRVLQKLNLTEQQEDMAVRIRADMMKERRALRPDHLRSFQSLIAELEKPNPDKSAIQGLVDRRIESAQRVAHDAVARWFDFYQTLTPDQKKTLLHEMKRAEQHMEAFAE